MSAKIVWFTGLSGTGKTTLSNLLQKFLKQREFQVKVLDGDDFRRKNKVQNNFTIKNILENNYLIIKSIQKIKNNYDYILVSVISPLRKTRKFAKKVFNDSYFEIYVNCSLKTLERRDTKGLYKRAKKNLVKNLIGYNSNVKYQKSYYSIININTDRNKIKKCIKKITDKIL